MQDSNLTPQQKLVLDYLKMGRTLTVKVAMVALNVNSLTKRISELRKLGYAIETENETGPDGRVFRKYNIAS